MEIRSQTTITSSSGGILAKDKQTKHLMNQNPALAFQFAANSLATFEKDTLKKCSQQ